jgi:hypothetical protein
MNNETRELLNLELSVIESDESYYDKLIAINDIKDALTKPVQEPHEMTWEEFAKIAFESASEFRRDRLIADKRMDEAEELNCEFYNLDSDKIESWTHGCAVALAAYKSAAQ